MRGNTSMGMIKSMTGFGGAETRTKFGIFAAELKTLNHKFLEITPKLPNSLATFEDKAKNLIKNRIKRGKVYLSFIHETTNEAGASILINESLAQNYADKLTKLKKKLNIEEAITLPEIISFPGVINYKLSGRDLKKVWPLVKKVINDALTSLIKDREKEGAFLSRDILKRINRIKKIVTNTRRGAALNVRSYKKKLKQKIKELSGGYTADNGRLEVEVALFAKQNDITEELTRLDNHIENFVRTLRRNGEVGKKLDFIAQELHREANTIGSKSSDFNISKGVIEAKTEIEKIREQLKNIE